MELEASNRYGDDGSSKRAGKPYSTLTWVTASAHIITAVIGSGVLSLSWAIAQLGWIAGPIALVIFSIITWFTSTLLADCCRDPVSGKRCSCYMDAVKSNLGGINNKFCGLAQYMNLVGITIGYSITSAISMAAIKRSDCFHKDGQNVGCHVKNNNFMIIFGIIEIILSQIPNFHELSWLSAVAAVMSFGYSTIGLGLSIAKAVGGEHARTSLTGTTVGVDVTSWQKTWNCFEAIGDIAFAYAFSTVLVEIQASPPGFNGAYQVFCQPIFKQVEDRCFNRWPNSSFIKESPPIKLPLFGVYSFSAFRVVWRTGYVILTIVLAMLLPFFNGILGFLGAASFWPLTVYFPIQMHISREQIQAFSWKWIWLNFLVLLCLIISVLAAAGSIATIVKDLSTYEPFNSVS
ncbi:hypothetical protein GOBAR_AA29291 [Gossypium barbadense]|uniref:Amino acid transporter transmembrane domain-containing protein n=1 Tax=Gossypium barbadense TaxID=3634 RepID=A0A2P5WJX4_GOSBA|nr:hypothetical protein GOBAR_AA29291 [Gossypium barbadense]